MGKNDNKNKTLMLIFRIIFACLFFIYFYFLQSPQLALAQHHLSGGQTEFYPLIGSLVLTFCMLMLQTFIQKIVNFRKHAFTLSFVPSVIVSTLPTAFFPSTNITILIIAAITFVIWGLLCIGRGNLLLLFSGGILPSPAAILCRHILLIVLCTFYMGALSNNNEELTYESLTAQLINNHNYSEAIAVGEQSLSVSPRLNALRAYALSNESKNGIGEAFFSRPINDGGSVTLLIPLEDSTRTLLRPEEIFDHLGGYPNNQENTLDFLSRMCEISGNSFTVNYYLCALLLERRLDDFAKVYERYFIPSAIPPKHYAEALLLHYYVTNDCCPYNIQESIEIAFHDFLNMYLSFKDTKHAFNYCLENNLHSYWSFYYSK